MSGYLASDAPPKRYAVPVLRNTSLSRTALMVSRVVQYSAKYLNIF